jgi:hypothetical protein
MIDTSAPEAPAVQPDAPTLESFFDHVRYSNPFEINRVVPDGADAADVEAVHRRQFTQLLELAGRAGRQRLGIGVVVWGDPGIGKSHLLARLGRWAGRDNKHAILIPLANLQASPETLPRSLLRLVLSILTRARVDQFRDTTLYRLVNAALRHALQHDGSTAPSWGQAEAAYQRLIDGLCDEDPARAALVDRTTYRVLFHFFRSAYRATEEPSDGVAGLAVRWLSGDALDADEARALELPRGPRPDEPVALADDQQVKNVLIALSQLASWWGRPVLLCFDQVENLEAQQFSALTRFLQALLDSAGNLLVITSGVQPTLLRWKEEGVVQQSAWDRIAQFEVELQAVNPQEARQIIQKRLEPSQEPFMTLEAVHGLVQGDILFPLGERWAQAFLADRIDIRPRDVMNGAREAWRRQRETLIELGGPTWLQTWRGTEAPPPPPLPPPEDIEKLIDEKVAARLQEHRQRRLIEPQTLPPDADNLAGLVHILLQRCLNVPAFASLLGVERLPRPKYGQRPPHDLLLRHRLADNGEIRSGLLCLVVSNRTSMTAFLRRLVQSTRPPERLFLVTDERRPLDPAATGQQYLNQLRDQYQARFRHVNLAFEQYAHLEALQAVVGDARSGDLEIELPGGQTRRVTEAEVVAAQLRQQCYQAHPLLRMLLTEDVPPPPELGAGLSSPPPPPPEDQDLRQFIMGRLAITMGASSHELATQYQDYLKRVHDTDREVSVCRSRLEEVARQLHQEGKLQATPHDDYFFLLLR